MLLGTSCTVNTEVSTDGGNNTWSAAYITGSTAVAATAPVAAAVDTKSDLLIVPEITSAVAQIRFTAGNSEDFDAGVIEVVSYYIDLTSLGNV